MGHSSTILFAYREVPQAPIGFSPFELVFGREVRGLLDILKEGWEAGKKASESVISYVLSLREHLELISELVKEHMSETQQNQKVWYDQTVQMRELRPNYQVVVLLPTTHNKLLAKWQALYTVIHRMRKVTYEVDMPESRSRRKIFHINLLKKWYELEETACMARDTEAEEDIDDIKSWKENIDSKITISGKLSTKQKEQLEVLL